MSECGTRVRIVNDSLILQDGAIDNRALGWRRQLEEGDNTVITSE